MRTGPINDISGENVVTVIPMFAPSSSHHATRSPLLPVDESPEFGVTPLREVGSPGTELEFAL